MATVLPKDDMSMIISIKYDNLLCISSKIITQSTAHSSNTSSCLLESHHTDECLHRSAVHILLGYTPWLLRENIYYVIKYPALQQIS